MENLEDLTKKGGNKKVNFFQHVFNFNQDTKEEVSNVVQYSIYSLIPVIMLNKFMHKFIPEVDDNKGSIEILIEIIFQIILLFLGIFIIHRIITYLPTWSGVKYGDFNITNIILVMLIIILSLQTKLGEKVSIIVDRFFELWDGKNNNNNNNSNNSNNNNNNNKIKYVKTSQPIANPNKNILINEPQMTTSQPSINYDSMYRQDNNPLINASNPNNNFNEFNDEVLPANQVGAFSNPFSGNW